MPKIGINWAADLQPKPRKSFGKTYIVFPEWLSGKNPDKLTAPCLLIITQEHERCKIYGETASPYIFFLLILISHTSVYAPPISIYHISSNKGEHDS